MLVSHSKGCRNVSSEISSVNMTKKNLILGSDQKKRRSVAATKREVPQNFYTLACLVMIHDLLMRQTCRDF